VSERGVRRWVVVGMMLLALILVACAPPARPGGVGQADAQVQEVQTEEAAELVIYSGRREQFVLPLIEKFEQQTGISVQLLSGSASEYALRIMDEARNPRADIFFANDAGVMEKLRLEGMLMPYSSPALEIIPSDLRAEDGSWIGLSGRARVFIFNQDLISEEEMPQSIFDLADPQYANQFAITRAGSEAMISHLTAVRLLYGDEVLEELIRGMLANEPAILGGHTDIRKAVGAGEFTFGLVNHYYYHLQLLEEQDNNVGGIYLDQGEDQLGTFLNVAGIALIEGAPNQAQAERFIEFLLEPEQLMMFATLNHETPVLPDAPVSEPIRPIESFRRAPVSLTELGAAWEETIGIMERAGYSE
jgi:iron(III) transport system substrate-binding protein